MGRNTPVHDEDMIRLMALVYGGDHATLDEGFATWADAFFAHGATAVTFIGSAVAWSAKRV